MVDRNKKELIDLIKERLKEMPDVPYREGAWEAFRDKNKPVSIHRPLRKLWVAAAVLAVFGSATLVFVNINNTIDDHQIVTNNELPAVLNEDKKGGLLNESDIDNEDKKDKVIVSSKTISKGQLVQASKITGNNLTSNHQGVEDLFSIALSSVQTSITPLNVEKPIVDLSIGAPYQLKLFGDDELREQSAEASLGTERGQGVVPYYAHNQQNLEQLSPKKMSLSNKFELGLFLSPARTMETFDVGGGMLLSYNISKNISVRTGAAFNQYEVGVLAENIGKKAGEIVNHEIGQDFPTVGAYKTEMLSTDIPYRANAIMKPNLKSVTGKVQTLDVPVEIKYNVSKNFYVVGGVSSAIVLSQERFNHLTEYTNPIKLASDQESDRPLNEKELLVRETKSVSKESNVNTNGFGGFINLSIGKKTDISRSLKISVEPFIKLPVGQFKRADMNYTNGGIKVITSF